MVIQKRRSENSSHDILCNMINWRGGQGESGKPVQPTEEVAKDAFAKHYEKMIAGVDAQIKLAEEQQAKFADPDLKAKQQQVIDTLRIQRKEWADKLAEKKLEK